ncbi:alanine racemase, partial [Ruminococcaceae bacterium OttesenSCG-928-D13]|nr:alanine racemase [Ruminococcaceae bacterium OttesenSCG-928-D13]
CAAAGIEVAGVIKGFNGLPKIAALYDTGACAQVASSRLTQLKHCKKLGIKTPCMLIRTPAPDEADEVVQYAEYSLNSEAAVLRSLNEACRRQNKRHKVILMYDTGDLREGAWTLQEMTELALLVTRETDRLILAGIGTNLGCYGAIRATPAKMAELIEAAQALEAVTGTRLEIISGGGTSAFPMVVDGSMPARINHLRIGGGMLIPTHWQNVISPAEMPPLHSDVFTLRAGIVEVKRKPSYPVGDPGYDCFGNRPEFRDIGMRYRAIAAVGRRDLGDLTGVLPRPGGCFVVGGSSDHMIVDMTDCQVEIAPGSTMDFDIVYENLLFLTGSPDIDVVCQSETA